MRDSVHFDEALLVRYLDRELPAEQAAQLGAHLAACRVCLRKFDALAELSSGVEAAVRAVPLGQRAAGRANLEAAMRAVHSVREDAGNSGRVMRRFGWGMAIAASLAIALLLAPAANTGGGISVATNLKTAAAASLEVNGESFLALPYSNPDLPPSAPRIVEMQVPVSSLMAAGIVFEPGASGSPDRTVLANVLFGIDGQPLGLHVLSAE